MVVLLYTPSKNGLMQSVVMHLGRLAHVHQWSVHTVLQDEDAKTAVEVTLAAVQKGAEKAKEAGPAAMVGTGGIVPGATVAPAATVAPLATLPPLATVAPPQVAPLATAAPEAKEEERGCREGVLSLGGVCPKAYRQRVSPEVE